MKSCPILVRGHIWTVAGTALIATRLTLLCHLTPPSAVYFRWWSHVFKLLSFVSSCGFFDLVFETALQRSLVTYGPYQQVSQCQWSVSIILAFVAHTCTVLLHYTYIWWWYLCCICLFILVSRRFHPHFVWWSGFRCPLTIHSNKILVSIMNAFNLAKITQTESVLFCLDKERL